MGELARGRLACSDLTRVKCPPEHMAPQHNSETCVTGSLLLKCRELTSLDLPARGGTLKWLEQHHVWDWNNEEQRTEVRKHESEGGTWGWKGINCTHRRKTTSMPQQRQHGHTLCASSYAEGFLCDYSQILPHACTRWAPMFFLRRNPESEVTSPGPGVS